MLSLVYRPVVLAKRAIPEVLKEEPLEVERPLEAGVEAEVEVEAVVGLQEWRVRVGVTRPLEAVAGPARRGVPEEAREEVGERLLQLWLSLQEHLIPVRS